MQVKQVFINYIHEMYLFYFLIIYIKVFVKLSSIKDHSSIRP